MSKTVYLVITDLHISYKNKDNRYNYLQEVEYCVNKIIRTAKQYTDKGCTVKLVFLGDIVDDSYKDMVRAIWLNNIFVFLRKKYEIYVTLGNHEFSFYKDNPFWSLLCEIKSEKIKSVITHTWQPTGLFQLVEVVDTIEDGNVVLNFNHYPTRNNIPKPNKINIGFFHKDYAPKAVVDDMKMNFKLDVWDGHIHNFENTTLLDGYDYAFFGHLHKVYGTWTFVNDNTNFKTVLYYLASLGRPNHTEVQDNFLERNIPAIVIEDGKFSHIEDNKFNLIDRRNAVKEDVVKNQQEIYQAKKESKAMVDYKPLSDNPITNIQGVLAGNPALLARFNSYLENDIIVYEHQLRKRVSDLTSRL